MVEKEIDSLCSQYGLRSTTLSEFTFRVNFPDPAIEGGFMEEDNSLYLPLYEEGQAFSSLSPLSSLSFLSSLSSLPGVEGRTPAYIQLVLDPEKASAEYLADFFNNPLGKKIRKAWEARGFIKGPVTPARSEDSVPEMVSEIVSETVPEVVSETVVGKIPFSSGDAFTGETSFAGEASVEDLCAEDDESTAVLAGTGISLASGSGPSFRVDVEGLTHSKLYFPDLHTQLEILKIKVLIGELVSQLSLFEHRLSTYPKSIAHIEEKLELIREAVKLANDSDYILELIRRGESKKLEFKSTLRMNLMSGKPDWNVEHAVLKTIVAYLNTDGGILLVGVSNDGEVLGIENDGFPNEDKFLLHFKQLIKQHIGLAYAPLIEYTLVPVNGKKILEIDCRKGDEAVFMRPGKNEEEFYIRVGPSSERLTGSKLIEYVSRRYNGNHQ
ncbi:ATP-binding protein [Methanosarcina sp. KYL-1]|uniref:AlbA family DNA-binding domain-containing protein n=1 Tax=Methanosarcina sp. KYL-1 TaxID=2602068 RepID=UPI002101AAC2|nr:ATP-binding protein [Methanosarcina sp. KYL-1]MCQ1537307.1 ATP-binding protein [Methanosarcina sp. KYL-1]